MSNDDKENCDVAEIEWRLRVAVRATVSAVEDSPLRYETEEFEVMEKQTISQSGTYDKCIKEELKQSMATEQCYKYSKGQNSELQNIGTNDKRSKKEFELIKDTVQLREYLMEHNAELQNIGTYDKRSKEELEQTENAVQLSEYLKEQNSELRKAISELKAKSMQDLMASAIENYFRQ